MTTKTLFVLPVCVVTSVPVLGLGHALLAAARWGIKLAKDRVYKKAEPIKIIK